MEDTHINTNSESTEKTVLSAYPQKDKQKRVIAIFLLMCNRECDHLCHHCLVRCTVQDKKPLRNIIITVEKIINTHLPTLADICNTHCMKRTLNTLTDTSHPGHFLFAPLPSRMGFQTNKDLHKGDSETAFIQMLLYD